MLLMVLNIFQEKILNIGLYIFSYRVAQEQKSLKYHGNPATCNVPTVNLYVIIFPKPLHKPP
uniref:Uncharacterized protein n=1 Tax=Meloidogyne enterolobii TaxID=390850 RepID=A0A6V7WM44_MELEN|nr:unnamed protein product [Meloidogyne enterolobii]